jgi:hypothetical protein
MIVVPREAWLLDDRFPPVVYQLAVPHLRCPTDYVIWISVPEGGESEHGRGHFTVNYASTFMGLKKESCAAPSTLHSQ